MPMVKRRDTKESAENTKIKIDFDLPILNSLIKYTQCEYLPGYQLTQLQRLIDSLDIEGYQYQQPVYDRLKTLETILNGMIQENLRDLNILQTYVIEKYPESKDVLNAIGLKSNMITSSECDYLSKGIKERVQYAEIFKVRKEIINILDHIDGSSFEVSYYSLVETLKEKMSRLLIQLQDGDLGQGLLREFSFSDEKMAEMIDRIVKKAKRPAAVLQTGMRQLNAILAPGFQPARLYCILGGSGKFKSGTLLNICDQVRRFNPQIVPVENGMRKCILFITLENSIEESIERIYDMYSGLDDDLRDKDTSEVIDALRGPGGFQFTPESGIDIVFRYYGNLEINTGEIYAIVQELRDRGKEPIMIAVDYIKRIDSVRANMGDERIRMSNVAKELKVISQYYEVPMLTAMQLNRDGNSIIDAAMRDNKQDVARFVGSSSIGNAWDIIEDSDWVCLINLECQMSTKKLFLTMKLLKYRGKKQLGAIDYFNHPFTNEKNIRLECDVDKDRPVSIISLASDLQSIEEEEFDDKPERRPKVGASYENTKQNRLANSIRAIELNGLLGS